jgi:ATP-dependent DNA helicase RecG
MDAAPGLGGQGMDIADVSSEEAEGLLQTLLGRKESPKLEFKRVSGEMVAKALRTVCAFANTRGGLLVLGIGDAKAGHGRSRLYGIEENPEAVDELFRKLLTAFVPEISGLAFLCSLTRSGFQTRHAYPERVLKEAVVNAVIHRDYRLNRDIFVRIFDDRVEVESPGLLPGIITPANIAGAGSMSRNPLVAVNLREFPSPPNIDAGEGVPMMFAEMSRAALYPPQYIQTIDTAVQTVTVVLLNARRPTTWDQVSDWVDRHGSIANADLVRIAATDTLKASKQLIAWRDQGLPVSLPGRSKRNMAYTKPGFADQEGPLLSGLRDNNRG